MVSIAMTTYNGEKYLQAQLDSILSQTFQDFEVVVCDDCSKDATIKVLKEYIEKDSRIRIFLNDKNLGFKKNFEKAISLCLGDYIALSDQDDIWLPCHLEILMEKIDGVSMACGDANIIDANSILQSDSLAARENFDYSFNGNSLIYRILMNANPFQGASSLFRKSFFEKALPIPEKVEYHDVWFSICACCQEGVNFIPEPITNYRIHGKNVSGNHEWSFFKALKRKLSVKKYSSYKFDVCNSLLERFKDMSAETKEIVTVCRNVLDNRINGVKRISTALFYIKHYSDIYTTKSKKYALFRSIVILMGR